ncbi:adenylate/guanylate cyclase domain-containing protein [Anabaena catenula]|uniref:Adenylate/guanylate cyclase domain-containing protein n=1 Tax=Anabaena catenula FACHB-362 TaxID=2692877 RepID=A0ABR8J167_9NOST|nr:adenylate/guanylate cyclase domain-containing protein [Anabaena catenula]MBD2690791.1 adenylate/guanylate cyclase domain-containing protein [Anabaena catenula FACHB-362]
MLRLLKHQSNNTIESKLEGTRLTAFISEFLSNSGHFLILKNISDVALYGWQKYITDPTEYLLIGAMVVQTFYLSKSGSSRFFGNLIGVSIYTLIDLPVDGAEFLQNPSHFVLWAFSIAIATLQSIRYHWKPILERWIIPLESVVRMLMLLGFYLVVSIGVTPNQQGNFQIQKFSAAATHKYLVASLVLVGLLLGFQRLQIIIQQRQLKETAGLLRNLAKWGMGSYAVNTVVNNPEGLEFQQCDRAILFMDIRGFTSWCEQTEPDIVASVLNSYYRHVEPAAAHSQPLRITLTADEIMAIYATPEQAVSAAQVMQKAAVEILSPYGIGAGCAVHCGTVVEGLFGGEEARTYTVIGDVVNTAKRLEGATPAGEITISDAVYQKLGYELTVKPREAIALKGKAEILKAWQIVPLVNEISELTSN